MQPVIVRGAEELASFVCGERFEASGAGRTGADVAGDVAGNNLLAESHIRYGGFGGLSLRHVSDTYIALFSHFIPCGVWEVVYRSRGY